MSDVTVLGASINARARAGALVRLRVRQLLIDILGDRLFHAEVVAAGAFHWRRAFGKEFGALYAGNRIQCDNLADVVSRFAEVQWRQRYQTPESPAYDGLSPTQLLDKVDVKSPLTQEEIDRDWQLEIAGDERAMRLHYEGSARVRNGADLGARKMPLSQKDIIKIVKGET